MNLYKTDCTNSLNLYKMDDHQTDLKYDCTCADLKYSCSSKERSTYCWGCQKRDIDWQNKMCRQVLGRELTYTESQYLRCVNRGDIWEIYIEKGEDIEQILLGIGVDPEVLDKWLIRVQRSNPRSLYRPPSTYIPVVNMKSLYVRIPHTRFKKILKQSGGGRATKPAKR